MKNIIASFVLLLLVGCASNERPAEVISPGQQKKVTTPVSKSEYYLVKKGDTCASIAKKFSISREDLLRINKLKNDSQVVPGQRLLVKVRPGDQQEQKLDDGITAKPLEDLSAQPADASASAADANVGSAELVPASSAEKVAASSSAGSSSGYRAPVPGKIIKDFGQLPDGSFNKGVNIAAPKGVPVKAISDGVVKYAGSQAEGYGKLVMIQHGDGKISTYAHLNTIDVKAKAAVSAGSKIGTVGSTGSVSQPQLHLQIRGADKSPIDPHTLINGLG